MTNSEKSGRMVTLRPTRFREVQTIDPQQLPGRLNRPCQVFGDRKFEAHARNSVVRRGHPPGGVQRQGWYTNNKWNAGPKRVT